ncbi:uncharacterized protein [Miscanthus floridulus]|uniref:uncharacterized protein isoform X3 n=1 Tax=Miscanthus floridulus TaxID=154761 RepID=UPI0034581DE3
MPVTRRRAAAGAVVQVVEGEEGRDAAIDISSDSDAGSESRSEDEEDSESEEEEDTSDEDFVDVSDSDSEAGDGEGSGEENEESEAEAEAEQLGADRSEVACNKITSLLSSGKSLEGLKLVECKAYLKKNGLSQTGGIDTCVDRILLRWRFKDGDPERIYPRSSFCVNCKVQVMFVGAMPSYSNRRCMRRGKRIVAGKVIKESYGKQKQQHTFTIQVFWSKGPGKLPPLHLLLVKGRNLYRMMTFRQPWANEVERLKVLEEKHNRGDDARRVRALNRPNSAGNSNFHSQDALKGKKKLDKEKHKSRSGRPPCQSNITELDKGKKRPAQSSKFDLPNKRSKKEGSQVPSGKETTVGRKAKKNHAGQDKSICTGHNSSLCNDNREKNHATFQKNCHAVPLNKGPSSSKVGMNKRAASSGWNRIGGTHNQLEERHITPAAHIEANHGNFVLVQHPCVERLQRPTELREVAHGLLTRPGGSHPDVLSNATMGLRHQSGAMAGVHAPAYFRGLPPNQQRVAFPLANMPQTVYHPHPEEAYVVPHFRYPRGSTGFRR